MVAVQYVWLYCETCKKKIRALLMDVTTDEKNGTQEWVLINHHEHELRFGICPHTMWHTYDYWDVEEGYEGPIVPGVADSKLRRRKKHGHS